MERTCEFIEFDREGDGKKEKLVTYGDEKSDCEIVIIQYMNLHLDLGQRGEE